MWQSSPGLGAGLDILALTATCARTFYVCFLPSWMDGFIQSHACIMPQLRGSSEISAPLPGLGEQRASPTPLCWLTCHVRYPECCKISTGENQCEVFHAKRGGSNSRPAYVAFEASKQKSGGSIRGAGFKKLRPAREARGPQQATG